MLSRTSVGAPAGAFDRFIEVALCDLTGPHDPDLIDAADFAAAIARLAETMPAWPIVLRIPYGPAPSCLFDQPCDTSRGPIARHAFIGRTNLTGGRARRGFAWYVVPSGCSALYSIPCRTHSEALRVAAGLPRA